MEVPARLGSCRGSFLIAVAFDAAGLTLLFVGIFANLRVDGRFYGDFLIFTGALVLFVSLGFWLMWYVGNLRVAAAAAADDGRRRRRSGVARLARKLSERLSQKLRGEDAGGRGVAGTDAPAGKAVGVTWGRSTVYNNQGYNDGPLSHAVGDKGGRL